MRILVPPDSIRTDESISLLLPWPRKVLSKLQPSSLSAGNLRARKYAFAKYQTSC